MKIYSIVGATEKEVREKTFNIYLGISLGNKWFTKKHMKQHLLFALENTKENVAVLIADTLHAINYEIRDEKSKENAIKKSIKKGDEIIKEIDEIISELPKTKRNKIKIIRWEEIKKTEHYPFFYEVVKREFENNMEFRVSIIRIVEEALLKDKKRKFTEEEKIRFCDYILAELPELLHGFSYEDKFYNAYLYPYKSALTDWIKEIIEKKRFVYLYNELPIKPDIFIELR